MKLNTKDPEELEKIVGREIIYDVTCPVLFMSHKKVRARVIAYTNPREFKGAYKNKYPNGLVDMKLYIKIYYEIPSIPLIRGWETPLIPLPIIKHHIGINYRGDASGIVKILA